MTTYVRRTTDAEVPKSVKKLPLALLRSLRPLPARVASRTFGSDRNMIVDSEIPGKRCLAIPQLGPHCRAAAGKAAAGSGALVTHPAAAAVDPRSTQRPSVSEPCCHTGRSAYTSATGFPYIRCTDKRASRRLVRTGTDVYQIATRPEEALVLRIDASLAGFGGCIWAEPRWILR
jgi:hypothetical protein